MTLPQYHRLSVGDPAAWQTILNDPNPTIETVADGQVRVRSAGQVQGYWVRLAQGSEGAFYAQPLPKLAAEPLLIEALPTGEVGLVLAEPPTRGLPEDALATALTALADLHQQPSTLPALLDDPLPGCGKAIARLTALGGWPGVLDSAQVALFGRVQADPQRLLVRLQALPAGLLHGAPWPERWSPVPLGLHDWAQAARGPGVLDVAALLDRLDLQVAGETWQTVPVEIDRDSLLHSYALGGGKVDGQAWSAARVLMGLRQWLPELDQRFVRLKASPAIWRTFSKFPPEMLVRLGVAPLMENKKYFAALFAQLAEHAQTLGY